MENQILYNHTVTSFLLGIFVIAQFFVLLLRTFAPDIEKKWHYQLELFTDISVLIITFYMFYKDIWGPFWFSAITCLFLVKRTWMILKNPSGNSVLKKYAIPIFLFLVVITGLLRFGAEWFRGNAYEPITTPLSWLGWQFKIGWDSNHSGIVLLRCLISGFIVTGILFFLFSTNPNPKRKKRQLEENRLQESLAKVQLESLYARVNPEFLHRSLQSIADLALKDGPQTRKVSQELARYFRFCINKEERHLVTLEEETEMTRIFIGFEQQSYPGTLEYTINLPENLNTICIPRLLLQSLAECSIREALENKMKQLDLNIDIQPSSTYLKIIVRDNGTPFPENYKHSECIKRIQAKLDLTFPNAYCTDIHNTPQKEIVVVLNKVNSLS